MSWFKKIQERQSTPDESRELKKGEIKGILTSSIAATLPDFEIDSYKNGTYYFTRTRTFGRLRLSETLNIIFSLKGEMFSCSASSVLNKTYLYSSSYNDGFLNGHTDLLVIKSGSGASPIEDSYYWHNGKMATVSNVVDQISKDFNMFGLRWFDTRLTRLKESSLVQYGLDFIDKLTVNKDELKRQVEEERKKSEWVVSRIKHPIFLQLKDDLQRIPDQSREDRLRIPGLTLELIEYYCDRQ